MAKMWRYLSILDSKCIICLIWIALHFWSTAAIYAQQETGRQAKKNFKEKGKSRVIVSATPQWYLNKGGVHNDGIEPDVISSKNTAGYLVSIGYERVTRYGLIINAGLHYGRQSHDVDVSYQSFSFFDSINHEYLDTLRYKSNYSGNVGYLGFNFMLGYQWQMLGIMDKRWKMEAKLGFSSRILITDSYTDKATALVYPRSDTMTYILPFTDATALFGNTPTSDSRTYYFNADLYLGLKKEFEKGILKNISLGIWATHSGWYGRRGATGFVSVRTQNFARQYISFDEYRSQDFSLGLRMAVGLWYK